MSTPSESIRAAGRSAIPAQQEVWTERLLDLLGRLDNERKSIEDNTNNVSLAKRLFLFGIVTIIGLNIWLWEYAGFALTGSALYFAAGAGGISAFSQTKRKSEEAVQVYKKAIQLHLSQTANPSGVVVFAVKSVASKDIQIGDRLITVDDHAINCIGENGRFDLGKYEELGTAILVDGERLDFRSPILQHQHWIRAARRNYVPYEKIEEQLDQLDLQAMQANGITT